MMSDFETATLSPTALDPNRRVHYAHGMVLGVDEFEQEQYYLTGRDRQHNRALHGYGTVCGLDLSAEGTRVKVSAGLALDPQGRVIHVARDQCADLDEWLSVQAHRDAIEGPGDPVELHVVLCYRECLTHKVPVPGAPCRPEGDLLAPSRVTESFDLRFATAKPQAREEEAARSFGNLLRRIEIDASADASAADDIAAAVRALKQRPALKWPLRLFQRTAMG